MSRCEKLNKNPYDEALQLLASVSEISQQKCVSTNYRRKMNTDIGTHEDNPFKLPHDEEIFVARGKQKLERFEWHEKQRKLPIWEKMQNPYIKPPFSLRKLMEGSGSESDDETVEKQKNVQIEMNITRGRRVERENIHEFIEKRRQMFRLQYELCIKREEIRKIEKTIEMEEKKVSMAEKHLDEDGIMFDSFLKDNDKQCVECIQFAERETAARLEKLGESKQLAVKINKMESDTAKTDDVINEFKEYKAFLDTLAPVSWQQLKEDERRKHKEEISAKRRKRSLITDAHTGQIVHSKKLGVRKISLAALSKHSVNHQQPKVKSNVERAQPGLVSRSSLTGATRLQQLATPEIRARSPSVISVRGKRSKIQTSHHLHQRKESFLLDDQRSDASTIDTTRKSTGSNITDYDDEIDMSQYDNYFKNPQDLFILFADLEDHNLTLIQNSQEAEEALQQVKEVSVQTRFNIEKQISSLKDLVETVQQQIETNENRYMENHNKIKLFSGGDSEKTGIEGQIEVLRHCIQGMYSSCIGPHEAHMDTLHMLTVIETVLQEMFDIIDTMPADKIDAAEKKKEKERRYKHRQEKLAIQEALNNARNRQAIARGKVQRKILRGRPLKPRSLPPLNKNQEEKQRLIMHEKEEEENALYFAPCCFETQRLQDQQFLPPKLRSAFGRSTTSRTMSHCTNSSAPNIGRPSFRKLSTARSRRSERSIRGLQTIATGTD